MMWPFRRNGLVETAAALLVLTEALAAERAARGYATQRLHEVKLEHEREVGELRRRLAIAQANFEWLSVSHNKVDAERSELFRTRLGVQVAPMHVQTRIAVEDYGAGVPREEVRERPYPENRVPDVGDLTAQGLSFDDVGDREASMLGLSAGKVYDDPSTLTD